MAGQLRKDCQAAKDVSLDKFKKENPPGKDAHAMGAKAYPLKFKEDLGPTLDSYESAKNPADKAKHKKKAEDVIKS
jgi:hypothetical protein